MISGDLRHIEVTQKRFTRTERSRPGWKSSQVAKQQCNRKYQLTGCHCDSNQCKCRLWEESSEEDDLKDSRQPLWKTNCSSGSV